MAIGNVKAAVCKTSIAQIDDDDNENDTQDDGMAGDVEHEDNSQMDFIIPFLLYFQDLQYHFLEETWLNPLQCRQKMELLYQEL